MRGLAVILCVAAVLRILAIGPVHSAGYTSDEKEYFSMARGILDRGEFIDANGDRAVRAPLYPGFVALLLFAGGGAWGLVHVIGCFLGTGVVWLTYRLAGRCGADESSALLATGIVAFYPGMIVYSVLAQTEMLYTFFFLLATLGAMELMDVPRNRAGVFTGLWAGVAALTRVVFAGFIPVLLGAILWRHRSNLRAAALPAGLVLCLAVVTILPWTLRNAAVLGEFVPIASGGGSSFLTGNNPYAIGTYRNREGFDGYLAEQTRGRGTGKAGEVERSRIAGSIAREWVMAHPGEAIGLALKKTHIFWVYPITHSDSYIPLQALAVGVDGVLALLCVAGGVILWPERRKLVPPALALLFFWGVQAFLHAEARFRLPLVPLMAVMAGVAGIALIQDRARKGVLSQRKPRIAAAIGWTCVMLVYGATAVLYLRGAI
jgi:4-amino-4-deoxy-L-arabinose transferase-like glycosyltransferase